MKCLAKISEVFVSNNFIGLLGWFLKWNTQVGTEKTDEELDFWRRLKIAPHGLYVCPILSTKVVPLLHQAYLLPSKCYLHSQHFVTWQRLWWDSEVKVTQNNFIVKIFTTADIKLWLHFISCLLLVYLYL